MQHANIRAVFLDAGDTLFTEKERRPAIYAECARGLGGLDDVDGMASVMQHVFAELPASVEGHYRYSLAWFRAFNERVLSEAGVPEERVADGHEQLVARFQDPDTFRVYDEVPDVLEDLANRGVRVGVVSNWSEHLPVLCAGLGLADRVNFILTSADLRAEKPERAIFERALFRAGVRAGEALHAGNHFQKDVRGALNAGLRAVWVHRAGNLASDQEGVPMVRDLRGVLPALAPAHEARS